MPPSPSPKVTPQVAMRLLDKLISIVQEELVPNVQFDCTGLAVAGRHRASMGVIFLGILL
jgi:hypothetical protein